MRAACGGGRLHRAGHAVPHAGAGRHPHLLRCACVVRQPSLGLTAGTLGQATMVQVLALACPAVCRPAALQLHVCHPAPACRLRRWHALDVQAPRSSEACSLCDAPWTCCTPSTCGCLPEGSRQPALAAVRQASTPSRRPEAYRFADACGRDVLLREACTVWPSLLSGGRAFRGRLLLPVVQYRRREAAKPCRCAGNQPPTWPRQAAGLTGSTGRDVTHVSADLAGVRRRPCVRWRPWLRRTPRTPQSWTTSWPSPTTARSPGCRRCRARSTSQRTPSSTCPTPSRRCRWALGSRRARAAVPALACTQGPRTS